MGFSTFVAVAFCALLVTSSWVFGETYEEEIEEWERAVESPDELLDEMLVEQIRRDTDESYNDDDEMSSEQQRQKRNFNSISPQMATTITDLHNKLRRQEGGSNMEILHYNHKLAALAQGWAEHCSNEHGNPPFTLADTGYAILGQNIFIHEEFDLLNAINTWYQEKENYNFNGKSCIPDKVCGHYTTVVWGHTTQIGCGIKFCPTIDTFVNAHLLVCNYAPMQGNYHDETPFLKGPSCTKCDSGKFFCNDNLCDETCTSPGPRCTCKGQCKRCGTMDKQSCKCHCRPGSMGVDCAEECRDLDAKCGVNPGYPLRYCTQPQYAKFRIPEKCPKMCGVCEPHDGQPCSQH